MTNKFKFFEHVIVNSRDPALAVINGREAPIVAMGQSEDGSWYYSLYFDDLDDEGDSIPESDLIPTGKIGKASDVYPGDKLRVRPDGSVVQDDEPSD